jgi:hypothetical protein
MIIHPMVLEKCFWEKHKRAFAFYFIKEVERLVLQASEEEKNKKIQVNQCTSQVWGRATLRPGMPAVAQMAASSLILATRFATEGWTPSKTNWLCCFQIIQWVSSTIYTSLKSHIYS